MDGDDGQIEAPPAYEQCEQVEQREALEEEEAEEEPPPYTPSEMPPPSYSNIGSYPVIAQSNYGTTVYGSTDQIPVRQLEQELRRREEIRQSIITEQQGIEFQQYSWVSVGNKLGVVSARRRKQRRTFIIAVVLFCFLLLIVVVANSTLNTSRFSKLICLVNYGKESVLENVTNVDQRSQNGAKVTEKNFRKLSHRADNTFLQPGPAMFQLLLF